MPLTPKGEKSRRDIISAVDDLGTALYVLKAKCDADLVDGDEESKKKVVAAADDVRKLVATLDAALNVAEV